MSPLASPTAVALLMALQLQGSGQSLQLEAGGVSLSAEPVVVEDVALYPITLLGVFGPDIRRTGNGVELQLLGDTLRVEPPSIYLVRAGRWHRLDHSSYRMNEQLFVTEGFLTGWLVDRHPDRLRYDARRLRLRSSDRRSGTAATAAASESPSPDVWLQSPRPRTPAANADGSLPGSLVGFIDMRLSSVYDSNIDHLATPAEGYGAIARLAVGIQSARSSPFLRAGYDLAVHRFPNSNRWNRVTHDALVEIAPRLARAVRFLLGGEMRLGSNTEDLERVNQFTIYPELEFRLTRAVRLELYAAQRMRRFSESVDRNATNRLVGAELSHRWGSRGRWELDGRYEVNEADWTTDRYHRWTGKLTIQAPLTRSTRLNLEGKYSWRQYEERYVESDTGDVLRIDRRWTPSAYLSQAIGGRSWELRLGYEFETNQSNDPDKVYRAHRMEFTIRRRF